MNGDAPRESPGNSDPVTPLDVEKIAQVPSRDESHWRLVVRNFSTIWFTIVMDTGIFSLILHNFPYQSGWVHTLSTIAFVLNLVLFIVFFSIYLLRWLLYFRLTWDHLEEDAEEVALQCAPAIGFMTLVAQVQLTCAQSWGHGWTIAAYILWWIGSTWILACCTGLFLHLIKRPSWRLVDRWLPTAVFVPVVGTASIGSIGGTILSGATNHTHISPGLVIPVIIVGLMAIGWALFLGIVVYAIYLHRLMTTGWPSAERVPGMILTIGCLGQSADGLLQLTAAAVSNDNFAKYARGTFFTAETAIVIRACGALLAILILGFAVFWIIVSYYAIISGLLSKQIHTSLFWWSSIFPVGSVVLAFTALGNEMDSPTFKILAVIIFVFLFLIYCFNASFTIPMVLSGSILGLPPRHTWFSDHKIKVHSWTFPRTIPAS